MRDAHDARNADGDRWRDEMDWQPQVPPINGARRLPPSPPMSHPPTPAAGDWENRTHGYDDAAWGRGDRQASAMTGRGGEPPASPPHRPTRSDTYDDERPGAPQSRGWSSLPPPPPSMPSTDRASLPEEAPTTTARTADEPAPWRQAEHEAARPQTGSPTLGSSARASAISVHDSDGSAVKAGRSKQRSAPSRGHLRATIDYVATAVRRSIPVRTLLFVLPPLVLPPLAFDLSLGATIAVALLLLWLVAATAALCMVMLEGSRLVAVRALGDRLTQLSDGADGHGGPTMPDDGEDEHRDRAAPPGGSDAPSGAAAAQADRRGRSAGADEGRPSHWPQQSGTTSRQGEQDDWYGRPAAPDPDWGESRWRQ